MVIKNIFKSNTLRSFVILILTIAVVGVGIKYTISFLIKDTLLTNEFDVGTVDIELAETFDGVEKKDVYAINKGDVDAYVRAAISISFVDNNGTIISEIPQVTDYSLILNSEFWTKGEDGFYYYKAPVTAGDKTKNLIESCKQITPFSDRQLVVEVIFQSIQAVPTAAVEKAWNVTVDNNHFITPVNKD
jgi:hypothetical protein